MIGPQEERKSVVSRRLQGKLRSSIGSRYNAVSAGCTMVFAAMFDEVDESMAIFELAPAAAELPAQRTFVPLNINGYRLPNDWYIRLVGEAWKMSLG